MCPKNFREYWINNRSMISCLMAGVANENRRTVEIGIRIPTSLDYDLECMALECGTTKERLIRRMMVEWVDNNKLQRS